MALVQFNITLPIKDAQSNEVLEIALNNTRVFWVYVRSTLFWFCCCSAVIQLPHLRLFKWSCFFPVIPKQSLENILIKDRLCLLHIYEMKGFQGFIHEMPLSGKQHPTIPLLCEKKNGKTCGMPGSFNLSVSSPKFPNESPLHKSVLPDDTQPF